MVYQEALWTLDTEKMLRLFFRTNFASFERVFISAKFWTSPQSLKSCFFSIPFLMNDSRHVILFFPQSVRKSWIWKWLFFFRFSLIFTQKNLRSFTMKRKWINQKKRILTPRKKMVPWYEKYLEVLFLSKICLFFTYFPSVSLNALQKLKILLFTNNIFNKILETRCFEIKYSIMWRLN